MRSYSSIRLPLFLQFAEMQFGEAAGTSSIFEVIRSSVTGKQI